MGVRGSDKELNFVATVLIPAALLKLLLLCLYPLCPPRIIVEVACDGSSMS